MRYFLTAAALLAATASADKRDLCSDGSVDDGGNYYCQAVSAITYTGVGGAGKYNKVTAMNTDGTCSSTPQGYSGNMSPLDEEVSMHFRGPLALKQFAVYTPGGASTKAKREAHVRRHAHGHGHAHMHHARAAMPEPQVGAMVTATIDGQVVSWVNEYSGEPSTAAPAPAASPTAPAANQNYAAPAPAAEPSSSSEAAPSASASPASGAISSSSGGWGRQGYYNAADGTADGLVFLNHYGGSGSGVFDYTYGASLSYSSSDGTAGSSSPQTLEDTTLPSVAEVVIMTDNECSGDSCGYSRDGTVAYHGFDGPSKAFFFEFQMPDDGKTASNEYDPVNMPAIWMLNAQIPRTLQYGQPDCSCWTSGCGEFDIFEVLAPGDTRMKSTLHGNIAGGDSDYFDRPESGTIKAALVLYNDNIHIKILDNDTDFGDYMDTDTLNDICGSTLTQTKTVSLFNLAS